MRRLMGLLRGPSEQDLASAGYVFGFACIMACRGRPPSDLGWTGTESRRELRGKIDAWCARNAVSDHRIVRNVSYDRRLHGIVHELWIRRPADPAGSTSGQTGR